VKPGPAVDSGSRCPYSPHKQLQAGPNTNK
jgi:hypothetical protein